MAADDAGTARFFIDKAAPNNLRPKLLSICPASPQPHRLALAAFSMSSFHRLNQGLCRLLTFQR